MNILYHFRDPNLSVMHVSFTLCQLLFRVHEHRIDVLWRSSKCNNLFDVFGFYFGSHIYIPGISMISITSIHEPGIIK